jgi:catechol 2,3-dioxygenase-like lactoylglutathione lyase family enzyme
MPRITGVLETCLHVENVEASARFYEDLFGFQRMESERHFCSFDVGGRSVLLLFLRGGTRQPITFPGGTIPPHGGSGELHLAFSIPAEDLMAWEERLGSQGIEIEGRVQWERGGRSLYFRDPDHHLVELVTPGTWANY